MKDYMNWWVELNYDVQLHIVCYMRYKFPKMFTPTSTMKIDIAYNIFGKSIK